MAKNTILTAVYNTSYIRMNLFTVEADDPIIVGSGCKNAYCPSILIDPQVPLIPSSYVHSTPVVTSLSQSTSVICTVYM